jgi:hypothetical protein
MIYKDMILINCTINVVLPNIYGIKCRKCYDSNVISDFADISTIATKYIFNIFFIYYAPAVYWKAYIPEARTKYGTA